MVSLWFTMLQVSKALKILKIFGLDKYADFKLGGKIRIV
jgi:hypothetical protein